MDSSGRCSQAWTRGQALEKRLRLLGVRVTALSLRGAEGGATGPSQGELSLA